MQPVVEPKNENEVMLTPIEKLIDFHAKKAIQYSQKLVHEIDLQQRELLKQKELMHRSNSFYLAHYAGLMNLIGSDRQLRRRMQQLDASTKVKVHADNPSEEDKPQPAGLKKVE